MGTIDLFARFEKSVHPAPGRALIAGSNLYDTNKEDRRKRYEEAIGIDAIAGKGVDLVHNLEKRLPASAGMFNHVDCLSVLEHSQKPWLVAANLEAVLPIGGTILVLVPFIWRVHNYPGDYWRFTMEGVKLLFNRIEWQDMAYLHKNIDVKGLFPKLTYDHHSYLGRTEVVAFGSKV